MSLGSIRAVGPRALLVEVDGAVAAAALAAWLRRRGVGADDVVPAATTVLVDGLRDPAAVAAVRQLLAGVPASVWAGEPAGDGDGPVAGGPAVVISVVYDGADLAAVARAWHTDPAGVVERHTATDFTAAFCGFAPGFAYLAGLPAELAVPRLATPRPRLAPGSVALADTWCGIYPTASPGGWRVLGHTDRVLWDVTGDPPALLTPGTRVRFVDATGSRR